MRRYISWVYICKIKRITDSSKEINNKDTKFKIGDTVRISKYKKSEEVFLIKKVKNTVPWTYVISDFKGKEIVITFCKKELQKTNKKRV